MKIVLTARIELNEAFNAMHFINHGKINRFFLIEKKKKISLLKD